MLAVPITTLLHELGHYCVFRALGFPRVELHYSSAGSWRADEFIRFARAGDLTAAAATASGWQIALSEAAGPLVSIILLLVATAMVRRSYFTPLATAIGLFSSARFSYPLLVAIVLVMRLMLHRQAGLAGNVDELNVASALGISPLVVIVPALLIVVFGVYRLFSTFPSEQRRLAPLAGLIAGLILGPVVYFVYVGPAVLP